MKQKIILADNEEHWRSIVHDYLENEGYLVLEAENGRIAVELLRQNPDTSLLILDVMMPELNGFAACQTIRTFSKVPILMMTAREGSETETSALHLGATQFLYKPIRMRVFMDQVRSLLRNETD